MYKSVLPPSPPFTTSHCIFLPDGASTVGQQSCADARLQFGRPLAPSLSLSPLLTLPLAANRRLALADPPSTRDAADHRVEILHTNAGGALDPMRKRAWLGETRRRCRRRETQFRGDWRSSSSKRALLRHQSLGPYTAKPATSPNGGIAACIRPWSRVVKLAQVVPLTGGLGHGRNDMQSPPGALILPCRDLRRGCDAVEPFSILLRHRICARRELCRFCCRCVAWEGLSCQGSRSHGAGSSETHRRIKISKYHITTRPKSSPINGISWRVLGRSWSGWLGGVRTSATWAGATKRIGSSSQAALSSQH
jgi:hypothetical protein